MAGLSETEVEGVRVLRLSGTLDHEGVPSVEAKFESAAPAGGRVVVDLSAVNLLTTSAIAMLVSANRRVVESGGRLVVTGASGFVDDLLRRCRLDLVLTIVDEPKDAVKIARR